ncbi:transcriptional activator GLI3-like [Anneissia japonica]|uniref:transcriptional activator GLI3-like n=1 Tax=Anneissia japonica TaxID=1529436 RepID=UPI00142571C8|nr:transcriptional activator GLI3-like [Anneissia japonica]XP_033116185.1 transcriptional activator GLI3-like [Anneissia japonica]XP_033116186.1 transcriptional activator GLI3-like [Anneissia japonica]XP_033116187.1 transcriptional activator GLI3-like [Anneissia japonica]XP_033116188.1 transcriptional activator GLI3-like [Anneissia japonica]
MEPERSEVILCSPDTKADVGESQELGRYEQFANERNISTTSHQPGLLLINGSIHDPTNDNNNSILNHSTSVTAKPLDLSTSTVMDSSIVLASSSVLGELQTSTTSAFKLDHSNMISFKSADQDDTPVTTMVQLSEPSNLVPNSIMQDGTTQLTITTATGLPIPARMAQTHNQVVDVLSCDWLNCFLKFTTQEELVNHVNRSHILLDDGTGYCCRWIGCTRNGKGFNAKYKMRIHVRSHTNEKPHQCHICKKCFSRSENLKIHKRSHTGEKPYACPVEGCNKRYSNSSDRFKHTRTHVEDKPYVCKAPDCNKRYTDPSSLRKHARSHSHYVSKPENPSSKPVKAVIPHTDVMLPDQLVVCPVLPTRTSPVLPPVFGFSHQYLPVPQMLSAVQANSFGVKPILNSVVDSSRTHDLLFKAQVLTASDDALTHESKNHLVKKENASLLTLVTKDHLFMNQDQLNTEVSQHSALTTAQNSSLSTAIST